MLVYVDPQGSDAWLESRRGVVTGSRFKTTREHLAGGDLSAAAHLYAQDLARERRGGRAQAVYVNAAMRFGSEQESFACDAYEIEFGEILETAGFICTDDRKFGVSVDRLVREEGLVEVKTLVSSAQLFKVLVNRDLSDYLDQVYGQLWLLRRKWCDLVLWSPDLQAKPMNVIRIWRDDNAIDRLEADLLAFEAVVSEYESMLARVMDAPVVLEELGAAKVYRAKAPASTVKAVAATVAPAAVQPTEFERVLKRITTARNQADADLLIDGIGHMPAEDQVALRIAAAKKFGVKA